MMRNVLKLILTIISVCIMCSCSMPKEDAGESAMTITFSFWEPGMAHELENALQEVADEYEKLHPTINIELISQPVETYQNWIRTQLVSETLPDIQSNHGTELLQQYNAGLIVDITEMLNSESAYEKGVLWKDTFRDIRINASTYSLSEAVAYIPFFGTELGIYYNKAVYDKLKLKIPKTWSEFIDNCQTIQESGMLPIAFMAQKEAAWLWLKWEIGGGLYSKKHLADKNININGDLEISSYETYRAFLAGELNFAEDKEYQEEYRNYIKRFAEFLQYCGDSQGYEESVAKAMFLSGEAAHMHSGSWDMKGIMNNEGIDFEVGLFRFPAFTERETMYAGKGVSNASFQSIGVTKSVYSEEGKLEAVIDFLQYLTSKKVYQQFINSSAQLPVIKEVDYVSGMEIFEKDGYLHDELLIAGNNDKIFVDILSGNVPVMNQSFFEEKQKASMAAAKKYAQTHNIELGNGYYIKEAQNGVFTE